MNRFCSWWLCLLDVTEQSFMMHHPVTEQPFCLCLAEAILSMSHLACMVSIHPLCPSHRRGWSGSSTRSIPRSRYRSPASSLPHFSPPAPSGLTLQILFFSRLDPLPHRRSGSCWTRGWSGSGSSSRSFTMVSPGL